MMLVALLLAALQPQAPAVMTRDEAAVASPAELERRLLAGFPHRRILRVDLSETGRPLSHVIFHEEALPAGGRFCAARRIWVTFDAVDASSSPPATDAPERLPRRVQAVSEFPLLAVLDDQATDVRCALTTRFAQLHPRAPDQGQRMVEAVVGIAEGLGRDRSPPIRITCVDERRPAPAPCDGPETLAAIDWKALAEVEPPSIARGPTTQMRFTDDSDFIWLDVSGTEDWVEAIALRRTYPPPF